MLRYIPPNVYTVIVKLSFPLCASVMAEWMDRNPAPVFVVKQLMFLLLAEHLTIAHTLKKNTPAG